MAKKPRNYAANESTLINVRAATKRLAELERRVTRIERAFAKWQWKRGR